jgi:hypothetical protein
VGKSEISKKKKKNLNFKFLRVSYSRRACDTSYKFLRVSYSTCTNDKNLGKKRQLVEVAVLDAYMNN